MFGRKKNSSGSRPEPTEAAKALLAQAAEDYASGWGASDHDKANKDVEQRVNVQAAQRSANRRWGREPQPSGDE